MSATVLLHNGLSEDKSRKLQMQLMMEKLRSKALQSQYKPLTDSIKNVKLALLVNDLQSNNRLYDFYIYGLHNGIFLIIFFNPIYLVYISQYICKTEVHSLVFGCYLCILRSNKKIMILA